MYSDEVLAMSEADIRELPPALWDDLKKQVSEEAGQAMSAAERAKGAEALKKLEGRFTDGFQGDL